MKFVQITETNLSLLKDFLAELNEETKTFRYYQSRDLSVIKNHLYTCLLLNDAEQAIGYGHVDVEGDHHWLGIVVKSAYQGRGLGSKIMEHLIGIAKKRGVTELSLSCDIGNSRALQLYKKLGFSEVNQNETSIQMSKRLNDSPSTRLAENID